MSNSIDELRRLARDPVAFLAKADWIGEMADELAMLTAFWNLQLASDEGLLDDLFWRAGRFGRRPPWWAVEAIMKWDRGKRALLYSNGMLLHVDASPEKLAGAGMLAMAWAQRMQQNAPSLRLQPGEWSAREVSAADYPEWVRQAGYRLFAIECYAVAP